VDRRLCHIIDRLLRKNPDARYPSASALLDDLEALGTLQPGAAPRARPEGGPVSKEAPTLEMGRRPARLRAPRRPRSRTPLIAAGVVVLLAAAIGVVIATRGPKASPALPQPDPAESAAAPGETKAADDSAGKEKARLEGQARTEGQLDAEIAALRADCNALTAEDQFGKAVELADAFAAKHTSGRGATEAAKLRREILAHARQRYDELARAADTAIAQKDYAKARAALKPVEAFGTPEHARRAAEKLKEIDSREKSAAEWAKWDAIKAEAKKLADASKYDEAIKSLEAGKGLAIENMADLITEEIGLIEAARREAAQAAMAAYAKESDGVWALFGERKYPEAEKLLVALGAKPELRPAARHLQADQEAAKLLREFWAAVEKGVAARKGTVSIAGAMGNILAVENGAITIRTAGGQETRAVQQLKTEQALAYAALALRDDERSKLAEAIFRIAEGEDPELAKQALAAAGAPPGLSFYQDRLAGLLIGAEEAEAQKAWRDIENSAKDKLTKAEIAVLAESLAAFEKNHGASKVAKEKAGHIAALNDRIAKAGQPAQPKVYTEWPFDAAEAKRRQEETARILRVKVQEEVDVGNGVKLALVLIPAGEFLMGSRPTTTPEELQKIFGGKTEDFQREFPQHRVRITRPFWLGKTEVTQEQWQAVMGNNPSRRTGSPVNPVEQVSWYDCQTFCQRLSAKLRETLRLPTEAEWEYACRAGTSTEFHFGDGTAKLDDYAWSVDRPGGFSRRVGMRKPNSWSLHDMHGSMWEWCEDRYGPYEKTLQMDPAGPSVGGRRVMRGGNVQPIPRYMRSATRNTAEPRYRSDTVGFRIARTVQPAKATAEGGELPAKPKPGEWKALFDGKSLKGWTGNPKLWGVRDGMLIGRSPGGLPHSEYLGTTASFSDFTLRLEVRVVGDRGNSGVQFRTRLVGPDSGYGYQAEIGRGRQGGSIWGELCDWRGARYDRIARPSPADLRSALRPTDWNDYEIKAIGDKIALSINGAQMVQYTEPRPNVDRAGIIALQLWRGDPVEIHFRNIRIQEIK
jgi:formylglycine-generating enzyme required for sulfatase activity